MKESKGKRRVAVAPVDEFLPGARVEIKVGKIDIAVFNVNGEYFAIFGICPHQSAPLSRGRLQGTVVCNEHTNWEKEWAHDGEVLVCPGHAMEFDLKTGKAFGYGMKLRTYDVIVEDDWVTVIL
jgi:nitrite reductase/ring-hydroxylating ferredoxin subunit